MPWSLSSDLFVHFSSLWYLVLHSQMSFAQPNHLGWNLINWAKSLIFCTRPACASPDNDRAWRRATCGRWQISVSNICSIQSVRLVRPEWHQRLPIFPLFIRLCVPLYHLWWFLGRIICLDYVTVYLLRPDLFRLELDSLNMSSTCLIFYEESISVL